MSDRFLDLVASTESKLEQEDCDSDFCIDDWKKDFQPGPLDCYRKKASFDWFELKVFMEGGEDVVRFKQNVWKTLERDPLFDRINDIKLSLSERRELTMKRCNRLADYDFISDSVIMANPLFAQAFNDALAAYDCSLCAKYSLNRQVSFNALDFSPLLWEKAIAIYLHSEEIFDEGRTGLLGGNP